MRKESRPERRRRRGNGTHKALPRHRGCRPAPRPTRRRAQGWARPRRAGGVQTPPVNGRPPRRRFLRAGADAAPDAPTPSTEAGPHAAPSARTATASVAPPVNTLGPAARPRDSARRRGKLRGFVFCFFSQPEVNARAHPGALPLLPGWEQIPPPTLKRRQRDVT